MPEDAPTGARAARPRRNRIALVDDQALTVRGLRALIEEGESAEVVGVAADTATGLDLLGREKPTLVILDIAVEGDHGMEFIATAREKAHVLVFTLREETVYAERCLQAGAVGFVSKRASEESVRQAVAAASRGEPCLSERIRERILKRQIGGPQTFATGEIARLSDRELKVLELLGQGASTREIAERLGISDKTVQGHHLSVRRRLDLANHNQLMRRAVPYVLEGE